MNGRVSRMIAVPGIPTYGSCYAQTGGDILSERTIVEYKHCKIR